MAQSDDIFGAIDRAVTGPSRASLSRWMRLNYGELSRRLDGHPNDWQALASVFASNDLKDRDGNPPTPQTARKTWERVRREAQKEKPVTETLASPKSTPPVTSPPERQPAATAHVSDDQDEPDLPLNPDNFRPAKLR